jgi:two-component system CheB/CheR fusion protein
MALALNQRTLPRTVEQLEEALRVSEARFDAIVDRSADGVLMVGVEGRIEFVNPAAETILDRRADELLGESFGVPIVPGVVTELDVLQRGSTVRIVEMRVVESQWQNRRAYLATLRDITDRKRREEECREAIRRRDEFLATLSHELRNPLAAIASAGQVLLRAAIDDPLASRARDVVNRESRQMARLIDDLLDVCRVSCGKAVLRRERIDFTSLMADVRVHAEAIMESHGLRFECEMPSEPAWVDADPVRLNQVATNLLTNAAKYTPRGGRVRMALRRENGDVVLRVEDTGIGIAAHELPLIFDPFFQGHVTLARSESGLGVGLSLVRGLVNLHGGRVEAHSDGPGRGSAFVVHLPILSEAKHTIETPPTATEAIMEDIRILIVEDNPNGRAMLEAMLQLEGYEVETAADGQHGLEMLEFQRPDVALIDIGLPGIDGYEVARRIRRNPANDAIYLIALTGYGQPDDVRQALEAGFDVHLVKPLDPQQLASVLSQRPRGA